MTAVAQGMKILASYRDTRGVSHHASFWDDRGWSNAAARAAWYGGYRGFTLTALTLVETAGAAP